MFDSTKDIDNYVNDLQSQLNEEKARTSQLHQATSSMFQQEDNVNLIEWQLEMDNILERIDHLLRGHTLGFDDKGNLVWQDPKNKDQAVFTEYGVQEILRILSMYLNRNTILSNYDEGTIKLKVYDLGYDIADLIFMKYEDMFSFRTFKEHMVELEYQEPLAEDQIIEIYERMRDERGQKTKLYMIIVRELTDAIHSAYLRALNGGERESLRTARTVTQSDPSYRMPQQPSQRMNPLRPTTWMGGR